VHVWALVRWQPLDLQRSIGERHPGREEPMPPTAASACGPGDVHRRRERTDRRLDVEHEPAGAARLAGLLDQPHADRRRAARRSSSSSSLIGWPFR
jgi:hypothetical protein